jgi:hypothetical protein
MDHTQPVDDGGQHSEGGDVSDRPTAQQLADLGHIIGAAERQIAEMNQSRIRYLAAILADTRGDGVEGEWAIRLWRAGVRPPLPTPRGFTNWGDE